jgi:tetraacyldisaccharide 4'-kinase
LRSSSEKTGAMSIRTFFEQLLYTPSSEEGFCRRVLLFPLYLISLLYRFIIQSRHTMYTTGILKSYSLPCKVISVGNITVGGTGKTPTVIYLAQLFNQQGIKTAVLSRGYKGKSSEKAAVVSDGKHILLNTVDAGDEPVLLSQALPGVPVLVGKDRVVSGRYAVDHFSPDVVLLDDGFQHMRLKRDVDILLLDFLHGFGNGCLLPRGILREPLSHIRRAHLFLLTKKTERADTFGLEKKIAAVHPGARMFFAEYRIKCIATLKEEKIIEPGHLKGKKVLALSAIANPRYFSYLLRESDISVTEEWKFPDHHYYTANDVENLEKYLNRIDFIITTEKDSVKMDAELFKKLPILVAKIMIAIDDEQGFKDTLFKLLS